MADITLKSSGINGGTAVNLQAVSIIYKWNNYVNQPDVPAKFAATDAQVEVDFLGWTNPTIVIRGVVDTNTAASNSLTLALLKLFTQEKTNAVYITDDLLFSVADTSIVQIKSFDISRAYAEDINEGKYNYSIHLVETL